MPAPLLYLSAADVRRALPMRDAIEAMREAFAQLARGEVTLPTRLHLDAPAENGLALIMPCHSASLKVFSLKLANVFRDNPSKSLPLIQSLVILSDGQTGTQLAIMEGASLTAIRTGAASGLATDLLARPDASVAAIIGTGVQARTQLEAICCVRSLRLAKVFGRRADAAARFAEEMSARCGIRVDCAATPAAALQGADIICTATNATSALLDARDVKPGAHINAVGAFSPTMLEIPSEIVCRARVVVDHRASALEEAGDLLAPLRAGLISEDHFKTELGELVLEHAGVNSSDAGQITLFKSVGVAIQDLCAAVRALRNARELGIGVELPA